MSWTEAVQLVPFWGFGLWLVAFPHAAIRFYTGLYRRAVGANKRAMPEPIVVRLSGVVVLCALAVFYRRYGL
jgi:hypothetical protein